MRDKLHEISAANEAFGGGNVERYTLHCSRIRNPRHHIALAPFGAPVPDTAPPLRVAVLLHLFYADLWPELRRYLLVLQGTPFRLYVSLNRDSAAAEVVRDIKALHPGADLRYVENRGFDVGAHWQSLETIELQAFDVVLLLQTKRNRHTRVGPAWRRNLLEALAGSAERWRENLWAFARNPRLGIIGSGLHRNSFDPWNYTEMKQVLQALGMPESFDALKPCYEHVAGTMFLIRAHLLAEMHARTRGEIAFERHEDLSLRKRFDRSTAHAMERAFGMYARWRGYEILWRP
jgi:lipopolysaccharide biosynthesis protein